MIFRRKRNENINFPVNVVGIYWVLKWNGECLEYVVWKFRIEFPDHLKGAFQINWKKIELLDDPNQVKIQLKYFPFVYHFSE
jgi:hypothetical protein